MPHQKKAETVVFIKTITTIRPYFFESDPPQTSASAHASEGYSRYSIDLGHLYWSREFDTAHLRRLLKSDAENAWTENSITNKLDLQAVAEVDRAKAVLGSFSREMPGAAELMFSFRVLSRCAVVASMHEPGLEPHITRGLIATEYNQYNLTEILKAAKVPETTAVGRCLIDLLGLVDLPKSPVASVINLRNDGELNQAVLLAAILKRRWPDVPVILDTSGANEQFNFNEWVPLLVGAPEIGRYIDYFLPRQDYGATQRALLALLAADVEPELDLSANVVHLSDAKPHSVRTTLVVPPIEEAFSEYIRSLPVFYTAGQRTIVGRLSPAKCHWAACKFCTINSQHIMPRGLSVYDLSYQHHFETLVNKIDKDRVESVILMDEALHPNVLIEFARALLSKGISISYRARCRFTNDLSAEACRLIYDSGCRYLGLGLEAASPRVNRLVHKHTGPPIDYDQVLLNLERAGIRMHIYAILGFPTETKAEIEATRNFLIRGIRRFRYLTVSANLFHLMRGSGMAQQPSDFNIKSVSDQGDVGLVLDFVEEEHAKNLDYAALAAQRVYQAEFLPDIDDPATAEAFWHFIDQTGVFYVQKVVCAKNPYHVLSEARTRDIAADFVDMLYEPSFLFWISDSAESEGGLLCDWVTFNYAEIPTWLKDFVFQFNPAATLRANAERLVVADRHEETYKAFRSFLDSGLFLSAMETTGSANDPPEQRIFRKGRVPMEEDELEDYIGNPAVMPTEMAEVVAVN